MQLLALLGLFIHVRATVKTGENICSVQKSSHLKIRMRPYNARIYGRKCMEKQLRKAKDRCFLYAIGVFFLACWGILKLHGYLSGMGFEDRSTPMLLIDSMLYFMLFFAVMAVRPVSSYFFSLYCKKLQKKMDATESATQGS
ncbi:MAG: hypothetical protein PHI96_10640 [Desulfovibrio sp.]|nr:hypothetical protein [Desulfovibrio sp.]